MTHVPEVSNRLSNRLNQLFYLVVLGAALTGASTAAAHWLNWPLIAAVAVVSAVELGGVALSVHADERRRLGEHAYGPRILSAAVAAGAVAVNFFGHVGTHKGQAVFFAGLSLLGYLVWIIQSGSRRRDQLRAVGKLESTGPAYGIYQWVRYFALTRRARSLALARPELGKLGSIAAAREEIRAERRTAAISQALRKRIAEHVDPTMAEIAVQTYDLSEVAARLAAGADYDGLTAIIASELRPEKISPLPAVSPLELLPAAKPAESTKMLETVDVAPLVTEIEETPATVILPREIPVPEKSSEQLNFALPATPPVVETAHLPAPRTTPDSMTNTQPSQDTLPGVDGSSLSGLSGTAAAEAAQRILGKHVPAGEIVEWLASKHNIEISTSLVYKVRRAHQAAEEASAPVTTINGRANLKAVI